MIVLLNKERDSMIALILTALICVGICILWCLLKAVFGDHVVGLPPEQTMSFEDDDDQASLELSYSDGSPVKGNSYKYYEKE